MLAVLTGGGTAGHINPALALAEELESRGVTVYFAGTPQGVESRLVPEAGIPFKSFEASGFDRKHPTTLVRALRLMEKSTHAAKKWFDEIKPDVVVGFGGYVSLAIGRAAEKKKIPVILHEQNSVMGLANKDLARHATKVCLTYQHAAQSVSDPSKVIVTGNPVRRHVFNSTREEGRAAFNIPQDALMLLITGGSLGARHLNQAIVDLKERLLAVSDLYIVHITGPKELETVQTDLALSPDEQKQWQVLGYTNEMGKLMAATDMIISRAGASSLAEISARAIPALLVPFPYATGNHQTVNAQSAVEAGCALMIEDANVQTPEFASLVMKLIEDANLRTCMHEAAKAQQSENAAKLLADIVIEAASTK